MKPNWMKFVRLSIPEGVDGGGGAVSDSSGAGAVEGAGAVVASEEAPAPAATFLTAKPAAEGEAKATETPPAEVPAPFDLAAIVLPEGFTLDETVGKSFSEILSDDKLSAQERGQKFMDLHTTALKAATEGTAEQLKQANADLYTKMNEDWRGQIKALPEFKANPEAEAGKVMQALVSLGASEDFFKAIDLTGAGNHPAILQMLHRLTSPHFEGSAVGGGPKPAVTRRLGDNIFTSANKS
jgi:hypothetical protein